MLEGHSFLSDFQNITGLSFWLFLFILLGGFIASRVAGDWMRRRFPQLSTPRGILLIMALAALVIAIGLLINPPSKTHDEMVRSGRIMPSN